MTRPHFKFISHTNGDVYRPTNSDEGDAFQSMYCHYCKADSEFPENPDKGCEIIARTMAFTENEDGYPKEWVYGENGQPCCTAFDDIDKPEKPYVDPRQMDLLA